MALIKLGGMLAEIRGSVGGVVFARNRGGAYARNRSVPINPASPDQVRVRSLLADLSNAWTTILTEAQRAAWELYAENVPLPNSLGELRTVTGLNMYVRANSLLLDTGGTRQDDGPTEFTQGPTITPTLTLDAAADTVVVTDLGSYNLVGNPVNMLVQQGLPQQQGVNFYKSPFRKVDGLAFEDPGNTPPSTAANLAFPIESGQAVFMRTATVTPDGRVGVPVTQRFLVA